MINFLFTQAVQFHFHWAKNDSTKGGSEHTLNGQQYFAEMHVVHYNTKYSSFAEAQNNENGLAVLGFFITVGLIKVCRNAFDSATEIPIFWL